MLFKKLRADAARWRQLSAFLLEQDIRMNDENGDGPYPPDGDDWNEAYSFMERLRNSANPSKETPY